MEIGQNISGYIVVDGSPRDDRIKNPYSFIHPSGCSTVYDAVRMKAVNEKLGGDRGIHLTYAAGYSDNFFSFYPASIEFQHRGFGDWLFFRFG